MSNIEKFDRKIDDIKTSLAELKKETSIEQKNKKAESTKEKINEAKEEINKRLDELKGLGDATSLEEIKKLEENLVVLDNISGEIASLEYEIKSGDDPDNPEKGRLRRQRDGVTSKEEWKENRWTNVGRVAMGVGAVSLAWRGIKKLFGIGKKKKESNEGDKKESKSRWKKALLRGAGITGGVLVWKNRTGIKDRFKELFSNKDEPKEKFNENIDESEKSKIDQFKIDIQNKIEDTKKSKYDFKDERGNIEFDITDEPNYKIKSWGKETVIGIDTKNGKYKIADLNVRFDDLKELIRVANLSNRFMWKYNGVKNIWNFGGLKKNNFIYQKDFIAGNGIYRSGYIKNTFKIVKESSIKENCPSWKDNQIESFVDYLNKRVW